MKILEKKFILIHESSNTIIIDDYLEELLRKEMQPILWCRDGLFSIVPIEILLNTLDVLETYKKYTHQPLDINIHWSQSRPVSNKIGHILSRLEYQC